MKIELKSVLSDELLDLGQKRRVLVTLSTTDIRLQQTNSRQPAERLLSLRDISGSSLSRVKNQAANAFLTIHSYAKDKSGKRHRDELLLQFDKYDTYEENSEHAQAWHSQIKVLLNINVGSEEQRKPLLVFVNPQAGAGNAMNIFNKRALTILNEANVPHVLVLTECANFAKKYVQTADLSDYRGIVAVSGDGLVYEIFNGLATRADAKEAIKTPVAQIPGGSANALACSLSYIANEPFRGMSLNDLATTVTFNLIKSKPTPLDIVSIQLCDKTVVQSFLSVQWAITADVDLESEKLRFLGEMRFTVGAIKRILDLRIYRGRISFLPSKEYTNYRPKDPTIKLTQNNYETEANEITDTEFPFKYLRPFNEPVPNDWLVMEENLVMFLIMNLPILTPDFTASTQATNADACMHMVFVKEGISRLEIIKLFTDTVTGNHLSSPYVEYVKIKAFRVEPLPTGPDRQLTGNLMVDGERVPYGTIQGEIMPSLANTFADLHEHD